MATARPPRFPSPLIEPDVRISRIRLSDWFHAEAHGVSFAPPYSALGNLRPTTVCIGSRQSPDLDPFANTQK